MELRRIYLKEFKREGQTLILDKIVSRRIFTVLRLKEGNRLEVFWDSNNNFIAEVKKNKSSHAVIELKEKIISTAPAEIVCLAQSILKASRMDWLVEKCVEIGIAELHPLISAYTVCTLKDTAYSHKLRRWQKIIISAAEQSGKVHIPEIQKTRFLSDALLALYKEYDIIFCCNKTHDTVNLHSIEFTNLLQKGKPMLFVGPEGGWSDEEIQQAREHKAIFINFGNYPFRAETTSVIAVAIVKYLIKQI